MELAEIYLFEVGIERALVQKFRGPESGWIWDCLFGYGIRLSALDYSQGRSRKI